MKKAEALSRKNSDVISECPCQGPVVLDENVDNAEKLILKWDMVSFEFANQSMIFEGQPEEAEKYLLMNCRN